MWKATNLLTHIGSHRKALRLYHLQKRQGPLVLDCSYFNLFMVYLSNWVAPLQLQCLSLPWRRRNQWMNANFESLRLMWIRFYITDISSPPVGCGLQKVRDFCMFYSRYSPSNKTFFSICWVDWMNASNNLGRRKWLEHIVVFQVNGEPLCIGGRGSILFQVTLNIICKKWGSGLSFLWFGWFYFIQMVSIFKITLKG